MFRRKRIRRRSNKLSLFKRVKRRLKKMRRRRSRKSLVSRNGTQITL